MLHSRHILLTILIFIVVDRYQSASAQPGYTLEVKKPKPYENRELKAEKSGKKKFTAPRRFFQNTTTHYNYFFNANNKINEIIDRAKATHRDDYANLLSFYNYSLDATAAQKGDLDSIISKTQTGIVQHDLRNDWTDDLYLLWGTAYYLQKEYDSAYQMFQFINYAYAPKEKDGYYKYIGSRMDGNSALSIATPEKTGFSQRLMNNSAGRNDALIWQIRTLTGADRFTEAGNMITTLRNDLNFPKRLKSDLEEVQAYWFYRQQVWDSAATHLVNAMDNASTHEEKARWEYLAGQLFERSGSGEAAQKYYNQSISRTTDPVMDIYARLNLIHLNKAGGDHYIDQNIAELLKMAQKDRYQDYRDVIYFMAAQMEMERNNPAAAQEYLLKGSKYAANNSASRSQSFLQLAELSFAQKKYKQAASFYDSIQIAQLPTADAERVNDRRRILGGLVRNIDIVSKQDSLQRIAALPEAERKAFVKKIVRQLRKQQGLKDEEAIGSGRTVTDAGLADPFQSESKGEWYFYNSALKSQGAQTFKQVWGNRPNVDNWRRFSDVTAVLRSNAPNNTRGIPVGAADPAATPTTESLISNLPLTPQQVQASNELIQNALFAAGQMYVSELEDYPTAIQTFEELRRRFPDFGNMSDVVFQLYHSYSKTGNTAEAAAMKKLLMEKYPTSRYAAIINTGVDPTSTRPVAAVTKTYEDIYNLFIEGKFAEALKAKQKADSTYKTNYWSPQLLYIEAVYYIKQRNDSTAINRLNTLIRQNPASPLTAKATNLIQVLGHRKQIEDELNRLQIQHPKEDSLIVVTKPPAVKPPVTAPKKEPDVVKKPDIAVKDVAVKEEPPPPAIRRDTTGIKTNDIAAVKPPIKRSMPDTLSKKPVIVSKPNALYTFNSEAPHFAAVILNKVDIVFGNETKNAFNRYNKETYYNKPLDIQVVDLDADNKLVLIGNFTNAQSAIEYVQKAKPVASTEIVPWLKSDKYSFTIVAAQNLEALKTHPDLNGYKKFLEQNLPLKF